jgi:hypothetical protein
MIDERRAAALAAAPMVDLLGRDINRCSPDDPVLIPRITHDTPFSAGPGWIGVSEYGTEKHLKPNIRCICGVWTGIGLHHVHADGRVTASFFDATAETLAAMGESGKRFAAGCGWHVFIKLDGYEFGDFPSEP